MNGSSSASKPCMEKCCLKVNRNKHYLFGITAIFAVVVGILGGVTAKKWQVGNTIVRFLAMDLGFLGCVLAMRPCGPEFNPQRLIGLGVALTAATIVLDGAYFPEVNCVHQVWEWKAGAKHTQPHMGQFKEDHCFDGDPVLAVLCFLELFELLLQICSFCALQPAADLGDQAGGASSSSASGDYLVLPPENPYAGLLETVPDDSAPNSLEARTLGSALPPSSPTPRVGGYPGGEMGMLASA